MKELLFAFYLSLVFSLVFCYFLIPLLKRKKAGQPIYSYVEEHKKKEGTPTMGGLSFILSAFIISLVVIKNKNHDYILIMAIGLAYMLVGFIDDFLKIRFSKNEGLKPYQKILFQLSISIVAGIYVFRNNLNYFFIPFTKNYIRIGWLTIPIVAFIFLAITNSVNLTDGLDGLSSTVTICYLVFLCLIVFLEKSIFNSEALVYDSQNILLISFCLIGSLMAFLFFNINKAKIFMGDTGSLSLGGFLGALSVFSLNSFFIPIIGIMFVVSSISVIVQVLYYKRTKKRIFLMAPYHHHLQHKGLSEVKICYIYLLLSLFFGGIAVIGLL